MSLHTGAAAPHPKLTGTSRVTSLEVPPYWSPEHNQEYPFIEYSRDLGLWASCCKVEPARQAGIVVLNLGGSAGLLLREIDPAWLREGHALDWDGSGIPTHKTGMEIVYRTLAKKFAPQGQTQQLEAISKLLQRTWQI